MAWYIADQPLESVRVRRASGPQMSHCRIRWPGAGHAQLPGVSAEAAHLLQVAPGEQRRAVLVGQLGRVKSPLCQLGQGLLGVKSPKYWVHTLGF